MKKIKKVYGTNPITRMDYPDPDVIRVNNTYYMVSTTMHFFPGCEILRSYDLINWEHFTYVYERIEGTDAQKLESAKDNDNTYKHIYGQGMWAPCIRYHEGYYYIIFSCNDTKKTYFYKSDKLNGKWSRGEIKGFYHDPSVLFKDGSVYIVYGNTDIHLTQLEEDLSKPKEGGIDRIIISDKGNPNLGYEGSHIYEIDGKIYVFLIHSKKEFWRRVEAVYWADSIDGEFMGGDILDEDLGFRNSGLAQGGIVDDGLGNYYIMVFQDSGAVGRVPNLVPCEIENGKIWVRYKGEELKNIETYYIKNISNVVSSKSTTKSNENSDMYAYEPLISNDDFSYLTKLEKDKYNDRLYGCFGLKSMWQFSHEPNLELISVNEGRLSIKTDRVVNNLFYAKNTLTVRMVYPGCDASVLLKADSLNDGDFAGLAAFQGDYAFAGIMKDDGKLYKVMCDFYSDEDTWILTDKPCIIREKVLIDKDEVLISCRTTFADEKDECEFAVDGERIGDVHKLKFRLDHFTGVRYGLFVYSTKETGGSAAFSDFRINILEK